MAPEYAGQGHDDSQPLKKMFLVANLVFLQPDETAYRCEALRRKKPCSFRREDAK